MVLPDDVKLLARGSIVSAWHCREPTVAYVEPIDNGKTERSRCLNDSSAHFSTSAPTPSGPCPTACCESRNCHPHIRRCSTIAFAVARRSSAVRARRSRLTGPRRKADVERQVLLSSPSRQPIL